MLKKLILIFFIIIFATTGKLYAQLIDEYSTGVSGNISNIISNDIDNFRDYQFGYGIGFWGKKNLTPRFGLVGGLEFSAVRFQFDVESIETDVNGTPTG